MPTIDMSCSPCCGGSSEPSSVSAVCCPDVPAILFATLTSACGCFNYVVQLNQVDPTRWQSDLYDDPCSADDTALILICDEITGTYTLEKLSSAACGWTGAATPATFVQCVPFIAEFSAVTESACDCAEGTAVSITITE